MTSRLIAIDGPGGAGKTTFANLLSRELGRAPVVQRRTTTSRGKSLMTRLTSSFAETKTSGLERTLSRRLRRATVRLASSNPSGSHRDAALHPIEHCWPSAGSLVCRRRLQSKAGLPELSWNPVATSLSRLAR